MPHHYIIEGFNDTGTSWPVMGRWGTSEEAWQAADRWTDREAGLGHDHPSQYRVHRESATVTPEPRPMGWGD